MVRSNFGTPLARFGYKLAVWMKTPEQGADTLLYLATAPSGDLVNGGYYDFEGSDWLNPPLFAHARVQTIDGRQYRMVDDGSHIHVIGWRSHNVLYGVTNTLLEELSNQQMLQLAKSAQPLH